MCNKTALPADVEETLKHVSSRPKIGNTRDSFTQGKIATRKLFGVPCFKNQERGTTTTCQIYPTRPAMCGLYSVGIPVSGCFLVILPYLGILVLIVSRDSNVLSSLAGHMYCTKIARRRRADMSCNATANRLKQRKARQRCSRSTAKTAYEGRVELARRCCRV